MPESSTISGPILGRIPHHDNNALWQRVGLTHVVIARLRLPVGGQVEGGRPQPVAGPDGALSHRFCGRLAAQGCARIRRLSRQARGACLGGRKQRPVARSVVDDVGGERVLQLGRMQDCMCCVRCVVGQGQHRPNPIRSPPRTYACLLGFLLNTVVCFAGQALGLSNTAAPGPSHFDGLICVALLSGNRPLASAPDPAANRSY